MHENAAISFDTLLAAPQLGEVQKHDACNLLSNLNLFFCDLT